MKKITFIFILFINNIFSQTILSWNIQNLGESKYKKDTILPIISDILYESNADIIAIQEVVTNNYGDSCIIYLANKLNYNYIISKKTTGNGTERYAYLYNKKIKNNYNYLDTLLEDSINREPFIASFTYNKKEIIIRQVHIVPSNKNPQNEINKLNYTNGIICGDFNLTNEHLIFLKFNKYFSFCNKGELTSLNNKNILSKSYDHFLIDKTYNIINSYVYYYNYDNKFEISDHLPIILKLF